MPPNKPFPAGAAAAGVEPVLAAVFPKREGVCAVEVVGVDDPAGVAGSVQSQRSVSASRFNLASRNSRLRIQTYSQTQTQNHHFLHSHLHFQTIHHFHQHSKYSHQHSQRDQVTPRPNSAPHRLHFQTDSSQTTRFHRTAKTQRRQRYRKDRLSHLRLWMACCCCYCYRRRCCRRHRCCYCRMRTTY